MYSLLTRFFSVTDGGGGEAAGQDPRHGAAAPPGGREGGRSNQVQEVQVLHVPRIRVHRWGQEVPVPPLLRNHRC